MTGVLPFLFFFTSTQSSQAYTIMDAVTINTIITSMDARTQTPTKTKRKDVPTYPEPEGDPSY